MSHLVDTMSFDANEVVSQTDFWVANINFTTFPTTREPFVNNNNNDNRIESTCHTYWRPSDSLLKILRSLYENDYP